MRALVKRLGLGSRRVLIVTVLAVALVAVGSVTATARVRATSDRLLAGVRIDGVDVGGMTRGQALAAVWQHVTPALHSRVTIVARGRRFVVTPLRLGRQAEVDQAVDEALAGPRLSWLANAWYRTTGQSVHDRVALGYTDDTPQVTAFVESVAQKVETRVLDASVKLVDGNVQVQHARTGWVLDHAASGQVVAAALQAGGPTTVELPSHRQRPRVSDGEAGTTVAVSLASNQLTLYQGLKIVKRYQVATARPGFSTPRGTWKVVRKEVNPSWHNPAPNGWGAGEPLVIPPGPGNPLGTRALALNAPGILIHGTYDGGSVGNYASHGCIRMHIPDAEALYPRVPVGAQVLIF